MTLHCRIFGRVSTQPPVDKGGRQRWHPSDRVVLTRRSPSPFGDMDGQQDGASCKNRSPQVGLCILARSISSHRPTSTGFVTALQPLDFRLDRRFVRDLTLTCQLPRFSSHYHIHILMRSNDAVSAVVAFFDMFHSERYMIQLYVQKYMFAYNSRHK